MNKKIPAIHVRGDEYYDDILEALTKKMGKKKSQVVHAALDHLALVVLGQEEVMNIRLYKHFNKKS